MRTTFLNGLVGLSLVTACAADVGGGAGSRPHGSGSGSGRDLPADHTNCEKVDTNVTIRTWTDFDGLPTGCWDLHAKLEVKGSSITSLARLGDLIAVDELRLTGTGITSIDTQNPIEIYGPLHVEGNAKLTSLAKLVPIELATTTIDGNTALSDIDIFGDVDRITGAVTIANNPALPRIDLAMLAHVGTVSITNNAALTTVSGLPATDISGDLTLRGNRALTTVGTMSALYRITGSLTVDDNDALVNLGMFPTAMKWIDGGLTITNNASLTDISQMRRLLGIGAAVNISNNANLSTCRAREVDDCVTTVGAVTIQNNKPASSCSSQCN